MRIRSPGYTREKPRITARSFASAAIGVVLATGCADAPATAPAISQSRSGPIDVAYIIEGLGYLPGGRASTATAINEKGVIVGSATTYTGSYPLNWHAYRHQGKTMQDLGTLPGHKSSAAHDINDQGYVVGSSTLDWDTRAVLWRPDNSIVDLGHLDFTGTTEALAINEHNTIAGYSRRSITETIEKTEAFRWTPAGGFEPLGGQFDYSVAYDVNEAGYIAGTAGYLNEEHAVIWAPDGTVIDLGTLDGAWAYALAINDDNAVVGTGETITIDVHAFQWTKGDAALIDLGPEYYTANDVSNAGRIVGSLRGSPDAFTMRSGLMTSLPSLSDNGGWAEGVNGCGIIVGTSYNVLKTMYAVRWYRPGAVCD